MNLEETLTNEAFCSTCGQGHRENFVVLSDDLQGIVACVRCGKVGVLPSTDKLLPNCPMACGKRCDCGLITKLTEDNWKRTVCSCGKVL